MPIMTVTTLAGKSLEDKKKLARDLTDCAQNVMQRPREIIRVIFHEIPAGSYAVAGEFLDPATDDDTILRISFMTGRTPQQKKEIIQHLVNVLFDNPAFSKSAVRVIIEETPGENFYRSK